MATKTFNLTVTLLLLLLRFMRVDSDESNTTGPWATCRINPNYCDEGTDPRIELSGTAWFRTAPDSTVFVVRLLHLDERIELLCIFNSPNSYCKNHWMSGPCQCSGTVDFTGFLFSVSLPAGTHTIGAKFCTRFEGAEFENTGTCIDWLLPTLLGKMKVDLSVDQGNDLLRLKHGCNMSFPGAGEHLFKFCVDNARSPWLTVEVDGEEVQSSEYHECLLAEIVIDGNTELNFTYYDMSCRWVVTHICHIAAPYLCFDTPPRIPNLTINNRSDVFQYNHCSLSYVVGQVLHIKFCVYDSRHPEITVTVNGKRPKVARSSCASFRFINKAGRSLFRFHHRDTCTSNTYTCDIFGVPNITSPFQPEVLTTDDDDVGHGATTQVPNNDFRVFRRTNLKIVLYRLLPAMAALSTTILCVFCWMRRKRRRRQIMATAKKQAQRAVEADKQSGHDVESLMPKHSSDVSLKSGRGKKP